MKTLYMSLQAVRGEKGLSSGKWNGELAKDKCISLKMKQYYFTALDIYSRGANYSGRLEASEWYVKWEYSTLCHFKFNNHLIDGAQWNKGKTLSFGPQFNLQLAFGYDLEMATLNKVTRQLTGGFLCCPKTSKPVFCFFFSNIQVHFPIKSILIIYSYIVLISITSYCH